MATIELKVPDIGDFKDVTVIEILVQPGDRVVKDQSLITVESDKASMEIPAEAAGVVKALKVKLGDKVSEGSLILTVESQGYEPQSPSTPTPRVTASEKAATASLSASVVSTLSPSPAQYTHEADLVCETLVLGSGPGGYSAAFRAADLGLETVIVERFSTLGGVCLNVGCIPSKALLHVASVMDEAKHLEKAGVSFKQPELDLDKLRQHKNAVVSKLTGGLAAMAKMRKVKIVQGVGQFLDANHIRAESTNGGQAMVIRFKTAIIAAGSEAVKLPFLPDDPRIVTSTGALELRQIPKRMLVIGGGIIGLEMATAYSSLFGTRVDVVEMLDGLMQGADRDLVKVWQKMNASRFDHIMLKTKTVDAQSSSKGITVSFEGEGAPEPQVYDLVLQAVGRKPNGLAIGAQHAGVMVNERGFIPVDAQMRTNIPHIFAIGDLVGQPMLAHKAVHEGHVAAEVIAGKLHGDEGLAKTVFDARVIPSVAYTDPEVAWVGLTEEQAKAQGIKVKKAVYPWSALGRAIANMRDEGFVKLLFSEETHRIVGGAIVGTHAGDLISEVALAIEMGADAVDIGKTIHPHPTLGESLGMTAELAEGCCTDMPPVRR